MTEENKETKNEVAVVDNANLPSAFSSIGAFENGQRMASLLAKSDLVPQAYKNNVANCLLALEVANRTGSSIMAVVQNLNVVQGKPSWSSSYIIAALNGCGRFTPLMFRVWVDGKEKHCVAYAHSKVTGELVEGPEVSTAMAAAEGWTSRSGSKWKTMPDLMLRYRAAAFFGRLYAPDILMGMHTEDEVQDIGAGAAPSARSTKTSELNDKIKEKALGGKVIDAQATPKESKESKTQAFKKEKAETISQPPVDSDEVSGGSNQKDEKGFY